MFPPRRPTNADISVILAGLLLLLFATPIADWWARAGLHWLTPYGLWLAVILLAILGLHWSQQDEP